jgi:hypothetical protein
MAITPPRALHADGSSRFNRLPPIGLAGTLTADNTSVTFTALDRQVGTFIENSANATFTGTDSKNDVGCAASDRGRVTGINIPYIANQLNGTFTSSAEGIFNLAGAIAQRAAQAVRIALKSRELSLSTRPAIRPNRPRTEECRSH